MTVLECINATATELGMGERVRKYLEGFTSEGEAEAHELLRCFNLVENELALDYLPLYAEDEIVTDTGVVYFSELAKRPVRVVEVRDGQGNDLSFRLYPEYLKTAVGKIVVRYAYVPEEKGFQEESDFALFASVRLFAYGMACEYLTVNGDFEEAGVWDKKYKEAIACAYRSKKAKRIASRRWA
jgi:hypothetical protein